MPPAAPASHLDGAVLALAVSERGQRGGRAAAVLGESQLQQARSGPGLAHGTAREGVWQGGSHQRTAAAAMCSHACGAAPDCANGGQLAAAHLQLDAAVGQWAGHAMEVDHAERLALVLQREGCSGRAG